MNPQTFFDYFERLADAPNAVARLREMILQLAVQGKLVEQDERDEPATRLLERIEAERKRLVRDKKIKEAKPLSPVTETEEPFEIPNTWTWVRLSEVGHDWGQKKPNVEFTYIDVAAIDNESGVISGEVKILHPGEAPSRARKIVKQGTVIYSTVRPYLLNIAIVDKHFEPEPIASTAFAIIHPFTGISAKYLFFYLRSKSFIEYVQNQMKGVAYPAVNDETFFNGLIPLPPIGEQKRIVAKVEELMLLCDELEQEQAGRRISRSHINRAALDRLLAARDTTEFRTRWQTVCERFTTLTATPDLLGKLRQTVLQLAVQGKLTRQDPHDEPATSLLRRIRARKERLVKEKVLKRADPLPPIPLNETPFELPCGWTWARLGDICHLLGGYAFKSSSYVPTSKNQIIRLGNVKNDEILLDQNPAYIPDEIAEETGGFLINENDVLLTMTGTKAKRDFLYTCLVMSEFLAGRRLFLNQRVAALRFTFPELSRVANIFLKSEPLLDLLFRDVTGTANQGNIGTSSIQYLPFPLPPLEEQKRIVAAVNRLMALCDELEANLRRAEEDGERLLRVAVRSLLASVSENSAAEAAALVVQ